VSAFVTGPLLHNQYVYSTVLSRCSQQHEKPTRCFLLLLSSSPVLFPCRPLVPVGGEQPVDFLSTFCPMKAPLLADDYLMVSTVAAQPTCLAAGTVPHLIRRRWPIVVPDLRHMHVPLAVFSCRTLNSNVQIGSKQPSYYQVRATFGKHGKAKRYHYQTGLVRLTPVVLMPW
jgi:hypothetical protein